LRVRDELPARLRRPAAPQTGATPRQAEAPDHRAGHGLPFRALTGDAAVASTATPIVISRMAAAGGCWWHARDRHLPPRRSAARLAAAHRRAVPPGGPVVGRRVRRAPRHRATPARRGRAPTPD